MFPFTPSTIYAAQNSAAPLAIKNSRLFLLCAINKCASVRLHRLRLLSINSPSGATKHYIYLYIYILRTMFKDHIGVCASACSPHLIRTFAAGSVVTEIQMLIFINSWVVTPVIITDRVKYQALTAGNYSRRTISSLSSSGSLY